MWEVIHKALLISIYKQINYYSIASEYYTGFKAELGCHYNRWNLKILGVFSVLSFVLLRHPLTQPLPWLPQSFLLLRFQQIFFVQPYFSSTDSQMDMGQSTADPRSMSYLQLLKPFPLGTCSKILSSGSFLDTAHTHLSCSLQYETALSGIWNCEDSTSQ